MLDENLPAFFFKKSPDGVAHHTGVFLSHRGSEPAPAYSLRHGDPAGATTQNRYAAGLFDSFNTDVLFAEVLIAPEWTLPTLSQDEIRRNNGVPPPPSPIVPAHFTVQLYNPDLQVTVTQRPGSWGASASYEFSLPQLTFRTPSASTLDRSQHDPAAALTTPKLRFVWRKESKLAKDLTCFMTGKSTDAVAKKKHRDPDIIVGFFRSLRELTVYEPNLYRVELEDPKGLELVLLLTAAVIKDLYFSNDVHRAFNVSLPHRSPVSAAPPPPPPSASLAAKRKSLPTLRTASPAASPPASLPPPRPQFHPAVAPAHAPASAHTPAPAPAAATPDPRKQWEIDAETARLRAQVEAEDREAERQDAVRRRERERADEAETRRLRKMVDAEEREARRRQEEVDRETARLREQYQLPPPLPITHHQRHSAPSLPLAPQTGPSSSSQRPAAPSSSARPQGPAALYAQSNASTYAGNLLMSGGNPHAGPSAGAANVKKKKKSFFGLRSNSDQGGAKLSKKASAVW